MGSFKHTNVFDPPALEIIDRVYAAIWAQLEARDPFRDRARDDGERGEALRKLVTENAGTGMGDFDTLYERVLADMPEPLSVFTSGPDRMQEAGRTKSPARGGAEFVGGGAPKGAEL